MLVRWLLVLMFALVFASGCADVRADETIAADGNVSSLPIWILDDTPEDQLPIFTGSPTPNGYTGAIPVYDSDGRLNWISLTGQVLTTSDDPLHVVVSDNITVKGWAESLGLTKGEFLLLLLQAQA